MKMLTEKIKTRSPFGKMSERICKQTSDQTPSKPGINTNLVDRDDLGRGRYDMFPNLKRSRFRIRKQVRAAMEASRVMIASNRICGDRHTDHRLSEAALRGSSASSTRFVRQIWFGTFVIGDALGLGVCLHRFLRLRVLL